MTSKKEHFFDDWSDVVSYVLDKRGIKQKWIVKKSGKSYSQVSKWLSGKPQPNDKNKKLIEDLLGILVYSDNKGRYQYKNAKHSPSSPDATDIEERLNQVEEAAEAYQAGDTSNLTLSLQAHLQSLLSIRAVVDSQINSVQIMLRQEANRNQPKAPPASGDNNTNDS